jgi:mannose-6-phosphate isomerase-like protein (cupin superfamily)
MAQIPTVSAILEAEGKLNGMETTTRPKALAAGEGLQLQSGPGRNLLFKVTGDDTNGALDLFTVAVAPGDGPPLHVHHIQDEVIYVLKGRYKIRCGDELFQCEQGGFAYLPAGLPHTFLNLTDEEGELIVVYTPGGCDRFYREFGPAARSGADRATLAGIFASHDMALLGPPLTPD